MPSLMGTGYDETYVTFDHCLIYNGDSPFRFSGTYVTILNSTIANFASDYNAMFYIFSSPSFILKNTIVHHSLASSYHVLYDSPILTVNNTLIYDCVGNWVADLAPFASIDGNLETDPMFVDSNNGDYHLLEGSPCIDAGDESLDPDPDGTVSDIGFYYYDQSVGINNIENNILSIFPNPATNQITINHNGQKGMLKIYNVLGEIILNRNIQNKNTILDISTFNSGVYFMNFTSSLGKYQEVKLIKQ